MRVDKSKWKKKSLGEVCNLYQPKTIAASSLDSNGKYLVYGANGVIGTYNEYNHVYPEILITCRGATCGSINISKPFSWINGNAMVVHPKEENLFDFAFLGKVVSAIDYSKVITGTAQPQITRTNLQKISISIPSFHEQQGIATELDAIQTMIDGYKAQITDLDVLAQFIFLDMFGDPMSNPKGWEMKRLPDLCVKMSTGPFGSMIHKSDYSENGIPSINPQDIKSNRIIVDNVAKVSYEKANELSRYKLNKDDVIIARRGDLSKCAIVTSNEVGWLCGTGSFFLQLLEELLPIVFYYQFTSKTIQHFLIDKSIGATMPNLNQGILSQLCVPLPPIDLQQQFASKVEAIERQKELIRLQLKDAETLMAERMQYYFS